MIKEVVVVVQIAKSTYGTAVTQLINVPAFLACRLVGTHLTFSPIVHANIDIRLPY